MIEVHVHKDDETTEVIRCATIAEAEEAADRWAELAGYHATIVDLRPDAERIVDAAPDVELELDDDDHGRE